MIPAIGLEYNFNTGVAEKFWPQFYSAFEPYFVKALDEIRGEITARIPDGATGLARRSIVTDIQQTGFEVRGVVHNDPASNSARYIYYVENGRGPGKFPAWDVGTPLYLWVKRKTSSSDYRTSGHKQQPSRPEAQLRSLSYLIARSIARNGTRRFRGLTEPPFAKGWQGGMHKAQSILEQGVRVAFDSIR